MSTTENNTKVRYETVLNGIRREATKIREANDRLREYQEQLQASGHPAPASVLTETTTTIDVALAHVRGVFTGF